MPPKGRGRGRGRPRGSRGRGRGRGTGRGRGPPKKVMNDSGADQEEMNAKDTGETQADNVQEEESSAVDDTKELATEQNKEDGRGRGRGRGRPRGSRGGGDGGRGRGRGRPKKVVNDSGADQEEMNAKDTGETQADNVKEEESSAVDDTEELATEQSKDKHVEFNIDDDISLLVPPTFSTLPQGPSQPMLELLWDHQYEPMGEKVPSPNIHICIACKLPIRIYGRLIPCKHSFCHDCAVKQGNRCSCCKQRVTGIEKAPLGSVFMCLYDGIQYGLTGCRRTYYSQMDLQAHFDHRHKPRSGSSGGGTSSSTNDQSHIQSPSIPSHRQRIQSPSTPAYRQRIQSPSTPAYRQRIQSPSIPSHRQRIQSPSTPAYRQRIQSPSTPSYRQRIPVHYSSPRSGLFSVPVQSASGSTPARSAARDPHAERFDRRRYSRNNPTSGSGTFRSYWR